MSINKVVIRKLWASSGGICTNPSCHKDLFLMFENGEIASIDECAHIIGKKKKGPRGNNELPLSQRDEFDNLVILCPSCHTLIDKNEKLFPEGLVKEWKKNHEQSIKSLFHIPQFKDRSEGKKYLAPLFAENHFVFTTYGPYSKNARMNQLATELEWERLSIKTILPNNRLIERVVEQNRDLLTKEEFELFIAFKAHREGFEYNKLSGDVNSVVTRFPKGFETVFE